MQKIKTVQPYKLYKKILKDRSKAKFALIGAIVVLLSSMVFDPDLGLVLVPLFLILSIPLTIYNPKLKAEYEPGVSYKYFRNYKNLQSKLPKALLDKEEQMRLENHQDVDFNVKVDLNDIYGVTDKLVMSYQNFSYEKKKMEDGDYLLGISPQGVYYVSKNQAVTKTKINFGDIDTLGLLAGIGNVFVFHIISKQNDEINIIVDQNDSLLVSPFMLFSALLKLLDDYILNGGVVANPSSKRRVVVSSGVGTSSGSTSASTQDATNNNRVIDLSYSTGVLEDMRTATFVGSNRQIEIDTPSQTMVVNEEPVVTRFVDLESGEATSNRNIDLDDLISSRIADVHRDYSAEVKTPLVRPIEPSQVSKENSKLETPITEKDLGETPKVEENKVEIPIPAAPLIEETIIETPDVAFPPVEEQRGMPIVETPMVATPKSETLKAEPNNTDPPQKKGKTGLIIGIIAAILAIGAIIGFLKMKNERDALLNGRMEIEQIQETTSKDLFSKDVSTYHFSENDLRSLSAKDLTYLRNSIYARHGYVFKSQELNNYFKQFEWYHPDPNVTEAALNSVEKANAEFIRNYQNQNGKTYIPHNATKGIFSVGYSQQVFFAKGNLQYQASSGMWRFANNQWETIGHANTNISANYSGWIDLFGWGTGNDPFNHSENNNDYAMFCDWGSYGMGDGWRTPTMEEWHYLFTGRSDAYNKWGAALVNGVAGIVVLPDDWVMPSGLSFKHSFNYSQNTYDNVSWSRMEKAGAIFLPAAGRRTGKGMYNYGNDCDYWSSTPNGNTKAFNVDLTKGKNLIPRDDSPRKHGFAVRLIKNI